MKIHLSILIIEDDKYSRLGLREILAPYGAIEEAIDATMAVAKLAERFYDVVVTDIDLGDGSGMDLIRPIVSKGSHCLVVSSYEGDEVVEKSYNLGASHFLSKFKLKEQLPVYVNKFLQAKSARFERFYQEEFITSDPDLIQDLTKLCAINWKNQSLFITGPTGTGKSLLGKLIHDVTHPEAPLIHLNCSEISDSLMESELFGHEKGAFTGADQRKEGKLKQANGGTLFLDEVGTMSLSMQQKLLKALDEKTFYPVGSSAAVKSSFTVISATCEDLEAKMARREFREDLFFRISGFQFRLKPLSERAGDIEPLIRHFQKKCPRRFVVKPEALERLKRHAWPGNVRELIKACERFSQSLTGVIDLQAVSQYFPSVGAIAPAPVDWEGYVLEHGLRAFISQVERRAVEESMKRNNGKITACMKELKISSSAFYRILQENKLDV